jgi:signal transduction histidine kinase
LARDSALDETLLVRAGKKGTKNLDPAARGMLDVARGVLEELELERVLERVLDAAQELSEARYAALGVLNEEKTELERFIARGIDEKTRAAIGSLPRGRGVLGTLIEHPVPLRLADVGSHPRSYGFPPGHPPMRSFLGVPILVRGKPYGNLYLTEKAGGDEFSEEDEQALVVLAEFAGVAIDHARRYTGTSERRDELEQTVAVLEATNEIARAVGGETDLGLILELVAKRGRALVSARTLLIELEHGDEVEVAAGAGEVPEGVLGRRIVAEDTVAQQAARQLRTQRLRDELNRARFQEHGIGRLVDAADGLVVPLIFRGRAHGVLIALDRLVDGPSFSPDDERLLEAFAVSAATAVAMARTVASERQRQRLAAAEGERQRWARELHDDTLQSLSALRTAWALAGRADRPPELLREVVRDSVSQIDEAIANLRALITDLRPAALDELGVEAAIGALAERGARHGMQVDVSIELVGSGGKGARHSVELETAVYRLAQEALTNAAKHGHARRAVVEISEDRAALHLIVRDDGCGFDTSAETSGFGLLGMHERVALLDGELQVESSPGAGTVVRVRLPVPRGAHGAPARSSYAP